MVRWVLLLVCVAACGTPRSSGESNRPGLAPSPRAESITLGIASWNVKRLGHGEKDLDAVADVIDDFDLVAVQEVMTRDVVDDVLSRLPRHRALLTDTPTPKHGTYREYFAFFYRSEALEPWRNTYVSDRHDEFERDPYVGCFFVVASSERLCLLTVHIVFGDGVAERKAEILALGDALRWAQELDHAAEWVVLGDFNRPVDDKDQDTEPEEEWRELLDQRRLRVPLSLAGQEVPTTLGKSGFANAYDHVFLSEGLAAGMIQAGRLDIVESVCEGDFARCRSTVSDHAPVYVEVEIAKPKRRGSVRGRSAPLE